MNLNNKPALRWCLTGPWDYYKGGPGNSCEQCPFSRGHCDADGHDIPFSDIANDPSESYYRCGLLNQIYWGEHAPCTAADWQREARRELGIAESESVCRHGERRDLPCPLCDAAVIAESETGRRDE